MSLNEYVKDMDKPTRQALLLLERKIIEAKMECLNAQRPTPPYNDAELRGRLSAFEGKVQSLDTHILNLKNMENKYIDALKTLNVLAEELDSSMRETDAFCIALLGVIWNIERNPEFRKIIMANDKYHKEFEATIHDATGKAKRMEELRPAIKTMKSLIDRIGVSELIAWSEEEKK